MIADNENRLKAIEDMVSSVRERYEGHVQKEDDFCFQKAEAVLEYAVCPVHIISDYRPE